MRRLRLLVQREEASSTDEQRYAHDHCGTGVPTDGALQQRGEPLVGSFASGDGSIGMKLEMRSLVCGHLEDDEGKTELEDTLQRDQAPERVVVTLLGG